ncbi:hypothetical protein [Algoriphagus sp. AK58]|uniref:hypothetical protein n=1 Tax=Algoriphagus sp. AK58 TaxID=1406877 RepID=UPI00164F0FE8|nr:hypothetical protein [Algoriphagus sp. AK58]
MHQDFRALAQSFRQLWENGFSSRQLYGIQLIELHQDFRALAQSFRQLWENGFSS